MAQVTDFNATQVSGLLLSLRTQWPDALANQTNISFADTDTMESVMNEQTAVLEGPLTANKSCKPIKLWWLEAGNIEVTEGQAKRKDTVPCTIDGKRAASNKEELEITDYVETTLKIPESECENMVTRDEEFQFLFREHLIALANKLAGKVPEAMLEFAGTNVSKGLLGTYAGGGTPDKSLTLVPAGNFNPFDIVPYIGEIARKNRFRNFSVYDGGNLYYVTENARQRQNTPAGDEGQKKAFNELTIHEDMLGWMNADVDISDSTFIVQRGSMYMATAAYGPVRKDEDWNGGKQTRFRVPLFGITFKDGPGRSVPVEADVIFRREMLPVDENAPDGDCEFFLTWHMRIWYIIAKNPLQSVNDGKTGIVRLKRDATLAQIGTPMQKALA